MGEEQVPVPSDTMAELAESRAFRLLLECHAQDAITRVLKRVGWMLTPVALVLGGVGTWVGWSKYTSWQETIARVDARMKSLDVTMKEFEENVRAASAQIETADKFSRSSRELVLGVQSGVSAAAGLLQQQAASLSETVAAQAAAAKADAAAVRAAAQAIKADKDVVEKDARKVHQAAELSDQIQQLWTQVGTLGNIQDELAKARLFHLVLLTAHREQTIEIRDPRELSRRPYELTFRSQGLRGQKTPGNDQVRTITLLVDVKEPGGARSSRKVALEDNPRSREFHCIEGTPFEVVLDFRYSRPMVKDFVALRLRHSDGCQAAVAAAR
jgi:hypothetical protein